MSAAPSQPPAFAETEADAAARAEDAHVLVPGVSWALYEALAGLRDDGAYPRYTYDDGVLEIMSPGDEHETWKSKLGRLVEAYSEELGVDLDGHGSWTIKQTGLRAAEADECYVVCTDDPRTPHERPDFAIEVGVSRAGLNKLDVWRKLGVTEVWVYYRERLTFYWLGEDASGAWTRPVERSRFVPGIDPKLLERFMVFEGSQAAAVRALREAVRHA